MARDVRPGTLVELTAGREQGNAAVIIAVTGSGYVSVADGRKRTVAQPKRKNLRHLRFLARDKKLEEIAATGRAFRDEELRSAITRMQMQKGGSDEQGRCH